MAFRAGRVTRDQNLNVNYNGVSVGGQKIASEAPKKGGTAGRKPLGDLSNVEKPLPKQASRKQNSNILSIADQETTNTTTAKVPFDASKRMRFSNASERGLRTGATKALSGISNSVKPCVPETSEKNLNAKRGIVIEEEGFLHHHQECIKALKADMHMDEFLHMIGLDNDFSGQLTLARTPAMSNKAKSNSLLKTFVPLEMDELLIEEQSPLYPNMCSKLITPFAIRTPEPTNQFEHWNDHDCVSYSLTETPYLPKH